MKIKNFVSLAVFAAVLLSLPANTFAYKTTSQSAIKINDTAALFLIDFDFGFLNADSWLPSMAVNKSGTTKSEGESPVLDYFVAGEYTANDYTSMAVVLSKAEITKDGNYYVPKGEREKFTLVVLLQKNPQATGKVKTTSVSVDKLLHSLKLNNKTTLRSFDQTLLKDHKTESINW